jgi:hypothetical protein
MIEKPFERDDTATTDGENKLEQELRSNFVRDRSDRTEKPDVDADQKEKLIRQRGNASREQGEIGEGVAIRVGSEKLELTPDSRFDAAHHGFDCISRDSQGNLCVVEAKFDRRGIHALRDDQMQPKWIGRNARMMQNPGNERFTKGNSELGHEIINTGLENVRRIVITNDPRTLEINAYEGKEDGSWELIGGPWSALEFEQPTPEW